MSDTTPTTGAVLIHLKFGIGKQGGRDEETTEEICEAKKANPEGIHADIRYICKDAFKPITSLKSEFVKKVKMITTPGDIPSVFLGKGTAVPKVLTLRDHYFPALECLKEGHLIGNLPKWEAQTRKDCGTAFKPERFPSAEQLREAVRWSLSILPLPESALLRRVKGIDEAILVDLEAAQEARVKAMFARAKAEGYARMIAPLQHMVDTLSKDSKPKIFETLVENLQEIVDAVGDLNHDEDPTLAAFAYQANTMLKSIDPDALRESPVIRKATAAAAQAILNTFGKVGGRKIITDEAAA